MKERDVFNGVYDLLIEHGGATPAYRDAFVDFHVERHSHDSKECAYTTEFRFMGKFGAGGKFWVDLDGFRINYDSEDRTDERVQLRTELNKKLVMYFNLWHSIVQGRGESLTEEQRAELLEGGVPCQEYPHCDEIATYFDEADFSWCGAHGPYAGCC